MLSYKFQYLGMCVKILTECINTLLVFVSLDDAIKCEVFYANYVEIHGYLSQANQNRVSIPQKIIDYCIDVVDEAHRFIQMERLHEAYRVLKDKFRK